MSERSSRIAGLSAKKRALLAKRLKAKAKVAAGPAPIPRRDADAGMELSFAQERFWFLDQWQPGSSAYNLLDVVLIDGHLDVANLATSLAEVMRRHEALRTVFAKGDSAKEDSSRGDGGPVLRLLPTPEFPLQVVDLTALPEARREPLALALGEEESRAPFDLATGPLVRGRLVRLSEELHFLLLNLHHIVSDLWSFGVLIREIGLSYQKIHGGDRTALPPLAIQYADFAAWQRRRLSGEGLEKQLGHWREGRAQASAARPINPPSASISWTR